MSNYKFNTENLGFPTGLSKHFIGFDTVIDNFNRATEQLTKATNYPPYNIKKVDDEHFVIEMAVAGFGKSNLDIEFKGGELVITGSLENDEGEYIHQGIANRAFTRKFTLADSVVVKNAEITNGMLKIALERFIPEEKKPKKIDIFDPFGVQDATKQFLTESAKTWTDTMSTMMGTNKDTK